MSHKSFYIVFISISLLFAGFSFADKAETDLIHEIYTTCQENRCPSVKKLIGKNKGQIDANRVLRWLSYDSNRADAALYVIREFANEIDKSDPLIIHHAGQVANPEVLLSMIANGWDKAKVLAPLAAWGGVDQMIEIFEALETSSTCEAEILCNVSNAFSKADLDELLQYALYPQNRHVEHRKVVNFLISKGADPLKALTIAVTDLQDYDIVRDILGKLTQDSCGQVSELAKFPLHKNAERMTSIFIHHLEKKCGNYELPKTDIISQVAATLASYVFPNAVPRMWEVLWEGKRHKGSREIPGSLKDLLNKGGDPTEVLSNFGIDYDSRTADAQVTFELVMRMIEQGYITPDQVLRSAAHFGVNELIRVALDYGGSLYALDTSFFGLNVGLYTVDRTGIVVKNLSKFLMADEIEAPCNLPKFFFDIANVMGLKESLSLLNVKCHPKKNDYRFSSTASELLVQYHIHRVHENKYWKQAKNDPYAENSDSLLKHFHEEMKQLPAPKVSGQNLSVKKILERTRCLPGKDCSMLEEELEKAYNSHSFVKTILDVAAVGLHKRDSYVHIFENYTYPCKIGHYSLNGNVWVHGKDIGSKFFMNVLLHELTHLAMQEIFSNATRPFVHQPFGNTLHDVTSEIAHFLAQHVTSMNFKGELTLDRVMRQIFETYGFELKLPKKQREIIQHFQSMYYMHKQTDLDSEIVAYYMSHIQDIEKLFGSANPFEPLRRYFNGIVLQSADKYMRN